MNRKFSRIYSPMFKFIVKYSFFFYLKFDSILDFDHEQPPLGLIIVITAATG